MAATGISVTRDLLQQVTDPSDDNIATPEPPNRKRVMKWSKDEKTKTSKCISCNLLIRVSSWLCNGCGIRVCSECVAGGARADEYKAIAADYLFQGCWCGFPSQFNPAFNDRIPRPPLANLPQPKMADTVKTRKRKATALAAYVDVVSEEDRMSSPEPEYARRDSVTPSPKLGSAVKAINSLRKSLATTSKKPRPQARTERPASIQEDQDTIVRTLVIGAGVIGSFAALEIAKDAQLRGLSNYEVHLIDLNDGPFRLASGHCTGILDTTQIDKRWNTLSKLSLKLWDKLIKDEEFQGAVAHVPTVMAVKRKSAKSGANRTTWFRPAAQESVAPSEGTRGHIEVGSLADYLMEQCQRYGVQTQFDLLPVSVKHDKYGAMQGLNVQRATKYTQYSERHAGVLETIPCSNLILAAGPFTPQLAADLYPDLRVELDNYASTVQWLKLGVTVGSGYDIGVILPAPVLSDDRYTDEVLRAKASRSTGFLAFSGCSRPVNPAHESLFTSRLAMETLEGKSTKELRSIAVERLALKGPDLNDPASGLTGGISFVSVGNGGKPVISKLPVATPVYSRSKKGKARQGGVWVAYGFGNHGTTLAPVAARVLSNMVHGEQPEVNVRRFILGVVDSDAEESEEPPRKRMKGKGRAFS